MTGWYVTAKIDGGTANQRTAYLVGPFTGPRAHMAAMMMVPAATHAATRSGDPRMAFASFGATKVTGDRLPPGRLDLAKACKDAAFVGLVITGGYR